MDIQQMTADVYQTARKIRNTSPGMAFNEAATRNLLEAIRRYFSECQVNDGKGGDIACPDCHGRGGVAPNGVGYCNCEPL